MRYASLSALFTCVVATTAAGQAVNYPVSVDSAGNFGNDFSYFSQISDDGRYVVFQSQSSNLAPGDSNGRYDVFRHDIATGTTELVSLRINGLGSANGLGLSPDVSGDGRFVVYGTDAANAVTGDTNGTWDVFVRDMQLGVTERISVTSTGAQANQRSDPGRITPDGRFVVFESDADLVPSDTNGQKDAYRLDRQTGQLSLVSVTAAGVQGTGWSYHPDVSDDGQRIVFTSGNDNFVAGDTNGSLDIFLKDMTTGSLTRVNTTATGAQSTSSSCTWPYISGDGSTVAFSSTASNLVAGDTNGDWDIFAKNVATGAIERLSVQPSGAQANDGTRTPLSLSTDGNQIIFASLATNLVAGDTNASQDAFIRNRSAGTTERVNLSLSGGELNDDSWVPAMSGDARFVTYTSEATNIVTGNTLNERQIFAIDRFGSTGIGTNFCTPNPNSTGVPSQISAMGSVQLGVNDVVLMASDLPINSFGFFLVSRLQGFVPNPGGSNGNLCLTGPIGRYVGPGEIQNSGPGGEYSLAIDLTAIPQPNGFVSAISGETWNFQSWHRDLVGGAAQSNFTDGLELTLQ